MGARFHKLATRISELSGKWQAFAIAVLLIIGWGFSGPIFGFSETWQLVINTGTTIITFLMVFLIQHTQNVDQHAMQKKLDEIVRAMDNANNELIGIEKEVE